MQVTTGKLVSKPITSLQNATRIEAMTVWRGLSQWSMFQIMSGLKACTGCLKRPGMGWVHQPVPKPARKLRKPRPDFFHVFFPKGKEKAEVFVFTLFLAQDGLGERRDGNRIYLHLGRNIRRGDTKVLPSFTSGSAPCLVCGCPNRAGFDGYDGPHFAPIRPHRDGNYRKWTSRDN